MKKSENTKLTFGPFTDILFLGGGPLLREMAVWAIDHKFKVRVITAPRHAAEKVNGTSFSQFLVKHKIPYISTEDITSHKVASFMGDITHTFCFSLGAAWIFKRASIDKLFQNRLYNLHGTRLPQNRGGGGFSWQIMTGNRFGFSVLHLIDDGIDTGDIVCYNEFLYPVSCRIPEQYEAHYLKESFLFLTQLLQEVRTKGKPVNLIHQADFLSSYWPRLHTQTNSWIDWNWDALQIERFICAFDNPYAGAQTYYNDQKVHLKSVSINFQDGTFHPFQTGLVYRKSKNWICVCMNGAGLIIESITDENGKNMFDEIKIGDRFTTPQKMLESGKQRVNYNPAGLKK